MRYRTGGQNIIGDVIIAGNLTVQQALGVAGVSSLGALEVAGVSSLGNDVDIGGKVTSASLAGAIQSPAVAFLASSSSGTVDEDDGCWKSGGSNDSCFLWLNNVLPRKVLGGTVYIESIIIYYYTLNGNTDYITGTTLDVRKLNYGAYETPYMDTTDRGKDEADTKSNYTITVNTALDTDVDIARLKIDVVSNNRVDIIGLRINYRLV